MNKLAVKFMRQIILILLFFLTANLCYSKDSTNIVSNDRQLYEKIQDDIKEIRRDQLNYKIEKDLLKETYSSNYGRIQIIISLMLGVFAVLGYLGLKGILALKKEYDSELEKLRELKKDFELKLKELTASQEVVKNQITTINVLNEEQNKKIKLLEIKEKVISLYSQKFYQRALEYVAIGLDMVSDDIELLRMKALSLLKSRNYPESIEAHKKILIIEPTNASIVSNLAELYLIVGQIDNYTNLTKEKKELFKPNLYPYFAAIKLFLENKSTELRELISDFIKQEDQTINKNYLGAWGLEEFYELLNPKPSTKDKELLIKFANYLKGEISGQQIKTLLNL